MILSAQTIRQLALDGMIQPFFERTIRAGKTYGLGPCTYDMTIAQTLTLKPGEFALASTIEKVSMPHNVCASVLDKSSWARKGLSVFNTHFDPGFQGYPTIELSNRGNETIILPIGAPICQFKFELLDHSTIIPYTGKYQNQPAHPVGSRDE
jgi:dCTP deaminase